MSTSCANCKMSLPDNIPGQEHVPCPNCGSKERAYLMTLTETFGSHDGHRVKAKNSALPSDKKLRFDTYSGVEPSHKFGKLVRVHRTIDRDNNRYVEKVVDLQTGEVLHECDEPLSDHINRGTAKNKNTR